MLLNLLLAVGVPTDRESSQESIRDGREEFSCRQAKYQCRGRYLRMQQDADQFLFIDEGYHLPFNFLANSTGQISKMQSSLHVQDTAPLTKDGNR